MKQVIKQAVLAGIMVGIGVIINTMSSDNRYIGAMLFSLALLSIIKNGLQLYTGKIGYYRKEDTKRLLVILTGNLAGVSLAVLSIAFCRESVYETMKTAAMAKFANSISQVFLYGLFCGILMFIAVHSKDTIITVFCIMVFILSGFEHCIADFPYLLIHFSLVNFGKFIIIVLGNSTGSILAHVLIGETSAKKERLR